MSSPERTVLYTYDAGDRLLGAGGTRYAYDGNGNRVQRMSSGEDDQEGESTKYIFDSLNRLLSVAGREDFETQYQYDGDGNRIAQQAGRAAIQYTNDIATRLPVVLVETGLEVGSEYVYGTALISRTTKRERSFYQFDGVGSVVDLTDEARQLDTAYAYDPWGISIDGSRSEQNSDNADSGKNPFRFTGEALDPNNGLYYLRARYYDPSVGRFISKDQFAGLAQVPVTANPSVPT